jgi:hypothetical protein
MDNFAHVPDMEDLRSELSKLDAQIHAIKKEKETILKSLEDLKTRLYDIKEDIDNRRESPHLYPLDAGAGTIEDRMAAVAALEAAVERFTEKADECDQPIEDFEEDRNKVLFMMADAIGIDALRAERTRIGKEMAKMNRLQHDEYKVQKERYEACKAQFEKNNPGMKFKYNFLHPADRAFIESHKELNQSHLDEWSALCDQRQEICDIIEAYDPEDQDLGLDEEDA